MGYQFYFLVDGIILPPPLLPPTYELTPDPKYSPSTLEATWMVKEIPIGDME
jgi:hypothetical protein